MYSLDRSADRSEHLVCLFCRVNLCEILVWKSEGTIPHSQQGFPQEMARSRSKTGIFFIFGGLFGDKLSENAIQQAGVLHSFPQWMRVASSYKIGRFSIFRRRFSIEKFVIFTVSRFRIPTCRRWPLRSAKRLQNDLLLPQNSLGRRSWRRCLRRDF